MSDEHTMLQSPISTRQWLAGAGVIVLLTAFLYGVRSILSPLLIGGFLLFFLSGLKELAMMRRLGIIVTLTLITWIFVNAQNVVLPFLISSILAYLFNPAADWLEQRKIPRTIAVLLIMFVVITLMVVIGVTLIPSLVREIQTLIEKIPEFATMLLQKTKDNLANLLNILRLDAEKLQQGIVDEVPRRAEVVLSNLLKGMTGIGALLGQILNIVLVPILTFYFIKDFPRIQSWLLELIPRRHRNLTLFYQWRFNRILGGYIRGQLIVATFIGLFTGLGLAFFRIPFALLLGFLAGLLNFIPYIGLYVSLGLAILATLFPAAPPWALVKVLGVFVAAQGMEAYVLSPKIVGERVGLHPVAVIFSILIFSRFLGFWGLIAGVPTAALIKFLLDEWKRRQKWREMLAEKSNADNPIY
ncbi:AI-2E family transporter [bacterium]|nr:AI-2E family transporter [bacterium]